MQSTTLPSAKTMTQFGRTPTQKLCLQAKVDWLPHLADYEGVSTVIDITSFALALLLVFRTNACYGR